MAKIAGIKLCEAYRAQYGDDFIAAMPTNLYGPNDNFDLEGGHLVPMLTRRFHDAKLAGEAAVTVWGTGEPWRELMHVDDLASACLFLMRQYAGPDLINVGTGEDETVRAIAERVRDVVHPPTRRSSIGQAGRHAPQAPRRVADPRAPSAPQIGLTDGLRSAYEWFCRSSARTSSIRGTEAISAAMRPAAGVGGVRQGWPMAAAMPGVAVGG